MLNFSRVKIFVITAICLFAIIFAIPSFISRDKSLPFLPDQKVSLGLDLRGGSHLLLAVDFDY